MTMSENQAQSMFSGLFQGIFPDGTIQYDDQVGSPEDFPLTEAELNEYRIYFPLDNNELPQE
jgi:hypothetical protein